MTAEKSEREWVEEIGKPAYEAVAELVAALQCDYDRLEELDDERADLAEALAEALKAGEACDDGAPDADYDLAKTIDDKRAALEQWDADNGEEWKELTEAAGDCGSEDDARQRIEEDALSLEVRSDWYTPGADEDSRKPAEFCILLSTGGPAVRIIGDLDERGEPTRARLEVQDWFKPWTEYVHTESETLLAYCRCFCFGE
jgi:hypothetical protein